ncbi:hypothetical protein [Roseococcus pinisoli]|uniref:Uncharacterized protein n=1 Tax=Roseococcus pinisoli TaxID=2835040 RepID=A0ABS5QE43_9PROT|nr:hypothetical protein [Roseococcus pinisoli]MBS7811205.1 hypothetical protein [Roseococcus pinisoli]
MSESVATAPEGEIAEEVVQPIAAEEQPRSPEEIAAALDPEEPAEAAAETTPEAAPEPEEEVEFDLGGTKLKVPKSAIPEDVAGKLHDWSKAAQRGHTQRSQEVADLRRAAEAELGEAQKLRRVSGEVQEAFGRGLAVKNEITALERAVADGNLWQTNPDEARRASDTLTRKRMELQQIAEQVAAGETALEHADRQRADASASQQREQTERMATEGREIVRKAIPTFDATAEAELVAYVTKDYGLSEEQAKSWPLNPVTAIMAHKAMMWDRAQQQAQPLKPPPAAPAAPIKGLQTKAAGVPTDPEHMTMDQYVAWRKSQRH